MKLFLAYFYVPFLAIFLAGCGSGGGDSGSNDNGGNSAVNGSTITAATASAAYTGLRIPVLLDEQSSEQFLQLFFNIRVIEGVLDFPDAAALNQTVNCSGGGTLAVSGGAAGEFTADFASCSESLSLIDGTIYFTINGYDQFGDPNDMTAKYQDVLIQSGDRSIVMTGVESYMEEGFSETTVVNATLEENGQQVFLENMTTNEVSYSANGIGEGETFTGRMYLSDHGYVDVNTTERIRFEWNEVGDYPVDGQMIMTGAGSSNVISQPNGNNNFRAFLDKDGNSTTDMIGAEGSADMDLVWSPAVNESPFAVISVEEDVALIVNAPIIFDGYSSVNHGGSTDSMQFDWAIDTDDMPFGANASIAATPASHMEAEFITDTPGSYWVELTVTDGNGFTHLTTMRFDVTN